MTTTRVRLTAESSGYGRWHVWLIGDPTLTGLHDEAVMPRSIQNGQLSTLGTALVDLTPTAEIVPEGTVYRCDFRKTGASVPERLYFTVPVVEVTDPVTVVDAVDYIAVVPDALPAPAMDALFVRKVTAGALQGSETAGVVTVTVPASQWGIYTSGASVGLPYFNSAGVPEADAANLHIDEGLLVLTLLGAS